MKTTLALSALLIPAVILAQPAPGPSSQAVTSPSSTIPAPPVNSAKAADALSTAKQLSSKLKGNLSSTGDKDCPKGSYVATNSGLSYCTAYS